MLRHCHTVAHGAVTHHPRAEGAVTAKVLSLRWRWCRARRNALRDSRRRRGCDERELDAESGTVPRRVGDRPASAELRHKLSHNAEAQTRACWCVTSFAESHERLPDPIAIGARHSWSFVIDTQRKHVIRTV